MAGGLGEAFVLALVPVDQVQLTGKRFTIHRVLGAPRIRTTPVAVELLQYELLIIQRPAGQQGSLSVHVHPPTVAGVDQAACVLWDVLPLEWLLLQIARLLRFGGDNIDRRLALATGLREHFGPFLGT